MQRQCFLLVDESGSMDGSKKTIVRDKVSQFDYSGDTQIYGFQDQGIYKKSSATDESESKGTRGTVIARALSEMFKIIQKSTYRTLSFLIYTDALDDISIQKDSLRKEFLSLKAKHPTLESKLILIQDEGGAAEDIEYVIGKGSVAVCGGKELSTLSDEVTSIMKKTALMTDTCNKLSNQLQTVKDGYNKVDENIKNVNELEKKLRKELEALNEVTTDIKVKAENLAQRIGQEKLQDIYDNLDDVDEDIEKGEKILDECEVNQQNIKEKKKNALTLFTDTKEQDKEANKLTEDLSKLKDEYKKCKKSFKSSLSPSSAKALKLATVEYFEAKGIQQATAESIIRAYKDLKEHCDAIEKQKKITKRAEKKVARALDILDNFCKKLSDE